MRPTQTVIERMREEDIPDVAGIHMECFQSLSQGSNIKGSTHWIESKYRGYPVTQYFVARLQKEVVAYVIWAELGAFRKDILLELEQVGVHPKHQGKGIGTRLILESLLEMIQYLKGRGARLKLVKVTAGTRFGTQAMNFYGRVLGAKRVCTIPRFFGGGEAVLIALAKDISKALSTGTSWTEP